jgi:hypothetical protein
VAAVKPELKTLILSIHDNEQYALGDPPWVEALERPRDASGRPHEDSTKERLCRARENWGDRPDSIRYFELHG